ncbi:MAG: PorT family protein [Prevotella sp.]|nr:PorT family protein [Prevotella sp.]
MKRILSLVCVMMLTIAASAQITWNAKGGLGVATLWGSDNEGSKTHIVAKAGVGIEYPLSSNLSLMPSLEFAWKGCKLRYGDELDGTLDLYYLQVPVVLAYRFNVADAWNITVKAGPYVAYAISDHFKYESAWGSESGSADAEKFDAGIDAGIDFEYHRFVFGVEAEMGFLKLTSDADIKNLAFYGTIGWKF